MTDVVVPQTPQFDQGTYLHTAVSIQEAIFDNLYARLSIGALKALRCVCFTQQQLVDKWMPNILKVKVEILNSKKAPMTGKK